MFDRVACLGAVLLVGGFCAAAASPQTDFAEAVRQVAEQGLIVRGTALRARLLGTPRGVEHGGLIFEHQTVMVETCFLERGRPCAGRNATPITVRVPAAAVIDVDGQPVRARLQTNSTAVRVGTLTPGEDALLLLIEVAPDVYRVLPTDQGKRPVHHGPNGTQRVDLSWGASRRTVALRHLPGLIGEALASADDRRVTPARKASEP